MIEFVEAKNGVIKVIDKDTGEELLEEFEHVELEPTFGAYYIGHTCGQEDVIVFSKTGERLYTREDARAIINGTFRDCQYGISDPYDILPDDFA